MFALASPQKHHVIKDNSMFTVSINLENGRLFCKTFLFIDTGLRNPKALTGSFLKIICPDQLFPRVTSDSDQSDCKWKRSS